MPTIDFLYFQHHVFGYIFDSVVDCLYRYRKGVKDCLYRYWLGVKDVFTSTIYRFK